MKWWEVVAEGIWLKTQVSGFRILSWMKPIHQRLKKAPRIWPVIPASFPPIGSKLTIPYFAVDVFQWIRDPSFTLTPQQILTLTPMFHRRHSRRSVGPVWWSPTCTSFCYRIAHFVITSGSRCNDDIPSTVSSDILQILCQMCSTDPVYQAVYLPMWPIGQALLTADSARCMVKVK